MRVRLTVVFLFLTLAAPAGAFAYRLPAYTMTEAERARPAEDSLALHRARLAALGQHADVGRMRRYRRNPKLRLGAAERNALGEYDRLVEAIDFWEYVVGLKADLIALHAEPDATAREEADAIAKRTIATMYRLSQEYDVRGSVWFHNFLVNQGKRNGGHCYHYVAALLAALDRPWGRYDLYWGEAWPEKLRENNALVITAAGAPFAEGIAIDAWRRGSRPFWTAVATDRFPWRELPPGKVHESLRPPSWRNP